MPDTPARAIRELRQVLGLTQVQLARVMGVSQADVSQWENRRNPTELYLRIMASLAGVNGKVQLKARLMGFVQAARNGAKR